MAPQSHGLWVKSVTAGKSQTQRWLLDLVEEHKAANRSHYVSSQEGGSEGKRCQAFFFLFNPGLQPKGWPRPHAGWPRPRLEWPRPHLA